MTVATAEVFATAHGYGTQVRATPDRDFGPNLKEAFSAMLPQPHPSVIFKAVSEGAVLLHTESEVYFGLNHVGAQVWELVAEGCDGLEAIVQSVADTYPDVPAEVIQGDISELLRELTDNGLLIPSANDDAPGQPDP